MIKTKKVTIGGDEYEITQLGAVEGREIWRRIVVAVTASLKTMATAPTLDVPAIAAGISTFLGNLDRATCEELYEAFGRRCTVRQGEKWPAMTSTIFDIHFAGNYVAMSQWLFECALFNFGSFTADASLGKLIDLAKSKVAAATASKSQSQQASTGTSGAS